MINGIENDHPKIKKLFHEAKETIFLTRRLKNRDINRKPKAEDELTIKIICIFRLIDFVGLFAPSTNFKYNPVIPVRISALERKLRKTNIP